MARHRAAKVRSIYDTEPTRRSHRPHTAAVAVLLAIAAAGGGYAALHPHQVRTGTAQPGPELPTPTSPTAGSQVTVIVDGWSAHILGADRPGAAPVLTYSFTGGQDTPLTLVPATDADIAALARQTPDVLTRVAARMVTVDTALACTAGGCRSGAGEIPLAWFTHPDRIPGYGPTYRAWGVTDAVYLATVTNPTVSGAVTITGAGLTPAVLNPASAPTPDSTPTDPYDRALYRRNTGAATGYQAGRYVLSAAFGQLFIPTAAWLGSTDETTPTDSESVTATWTGRPAALTDDTTGFLHGLATPVAAAGGLDPSQLTFLSSPTTGCGSGVVCVPGTATPDVASRDVHRYAVCPTSPPATGQTVARRLGAVVTDTRLTVRYAHPVVQWGAWNGSDRNRFPGRTAAHGFYTGIPPTVAGAQQLRFSEVAFYAAGDTALVPPAPTALVGYAGRTQQAPYDSAAMAQPFDPAQAWQRLTVAGVHYAPCR